MEHKMEKVRRSPRRSQKKKPSYLRLVVNAVPQKGKSKKSQINELKNRVSKALPEYDVEELNSSSEGAVPDVEAYDLTKLLEAYKEAHPGEGDDVSLQQVFDWNKEAKIAVPKDDLFEICHS